jgi:hypothetical protein
MSSVGVGTGHGVDGRGSISGRGKSFSLLRSIQTGSGVHPAFYPMCTKRSFPWGQSSRGVKQTTHINVVSRLRLHSPDTSLWRGAQLIKHWDNPLNFTFFKLKSFSFD